MQGAQILNLGQEAPRKNTEPPRIEDEYDLSLQLIRVRQARTCTDAVLQSRRGLVLQILELLGV